MAFYTFYSSYLKVYLAEKIHSKNEITIDYINDIIERQTLEDIDNIFADTEIEFFELLEDSEGTISLESKENVDIVIDYLIKSGVAPKYIEEIIPSDNFWKVLQLLKDTDSPEYRFINRLTFSIIVANIIGIIVIIIGMLIFTRRTILPIKDITGKIRTLKPGEDYETIEYKNQRDEVGLLIHAINGLNQRLKLQESIRSRLLADISHELKTPITSIQCYLEGISDGVITLSEKNLGSITSEMKRLIKLVNKIMEYEKFESRELVLEKTEENISEIIKEVVETHKKRLKETKQRIKIVGDEELVETLDNGLFKQVIHNIIGNFLKYAGKKTILTINITKNYIDLFDNGGGIRATEVPFLTEKFYQGNIEKSGDIATRGIGIGLSLVKKIVVAHGWKLEIKSDIGKGFSIKIKL